MQIEGSGVVVVGGASGLGEATARRLAKLGAAVTVLDRNAGHGAALVQELGDGARFIEVDVVDSEAVEAAIRASDVGASLRIVVCTAGIAAAARLVGRDGTPHPVELFREVFEVNVAGTFNVLRAGAAVIAEKESTVDGERGVIVTTASTAAYEGQIGAVAYAASKAAIVGMTLPASRDLMSRGIRIVCVAPGAFSTPMTEGDVPEDRRNAFADQHLFPQRMGHPAEFASLVEHIVTNPYLNGSTLRLDAGLRVPPR